MTKDEAARTAAGRLEAIERWSRRTFLATAVAAAILAAIGAGLAVVGRGAPCAQSVRKMRRLRALVLDAIEESDDVTSLHVTAGGNGRCEMRAGMTPDPEDARPGRWNSLDPDMFVRLTFFDDENESW